MKRNECLECEELDRISCEQDDIINTIGEAIIDIAYENNDFICGQCIKTANLLLSVLMRYAREDDVADVIEQFYNLSGINLEA